MNPHGTARRLLPRLVVAGPERAAAIARARSLTRLTVSSRETSDLIMLGIGAFTPLTGFMSSADWRSVCDRMALADGTFWPVPITLSAAGRRRGLSAWARTSLWPTRRRAS